MIQVLHRGRGFAVVDKPAGLAVEADGEASVLKQLARELGPPGGRAFPRVVHRLDTQTSGCLLVALTDAAQAALVKSFEAGAIDKEYLVLVVGAPPERGTCDTAYGPDPRDRRRFTTRLSTPRRARLSYTVEARLPGAALVRVKLETGRTHQIRVQLGESGFPVLGDSTYGNAESTALAAAAGLGRHALHAARLTLPDSEGGAQLRCEAPLPGDLQAAISVLRRGP